MFDDFFCFQYQLFDILANFCHQIKSKIEKLNLIKFDFMRLIRL